MNQNKNWDCPKCNESIEPQFDTCWNCNFQNLTDNEKKILEESAKNIDTVKLGKLSTKYQALRTFQNVIWIIFIIMCLITMAASYYYLDTLADIKTVKLSDIIKTIGPSLLHLAFSFYCIKMFSKMIDFLFDLDDNNNK